MQEQSLDHCQAYPQKVQTWDQRMDEQARSMEPRSDPLSEFPPQPRCGQDARRHPSGFDFRGQLYRITRVDLTQIEGLELQTAQTIISEVGLGSRRWQTESHFASWLALGPSNRINGKVLNRPSTAVRLTTSAPKPNCFGSQVPPAALQAWGTRSHPRHGTLLALLVYRMLPFGHEYVDRGIEFYEISYRQKRRAGVAKQAAALRMQLIQITEVARKVSGEQPLIGR